MLGMVAQKYTLSFATPNILSHHPQYFVAPCDLERVFLGIVKGMEMSPLSHLACCWRKGTLDEHLTDLERS